MDTACRAALDQRILGRSAAAEAVREIARRAARVDAPLLLTGETGTGKGVLARAIHDISPRAPRAFVSVNCAGVPDSLFESAFFGHVRGAFTGALQSHRGYFEQADGGTLFLDEIGELPPALQAKLLTTLDDGELRRVGSERSLRVRARLICASNRDLQHDVAQRRFRADLYHRLRVLTFRLPPLRDRGDDAELLARHFLRLAQHRYQCPARDFAPAAIERIRAHPWPGNIRELAHAVEAAALACDRTHIRARDLPEPACLGAAPQHPLAAEHDIDGRDSDHDHGAARRRYSFYGPPGQERSLILDALRRCRGNKTRAAARLGMARNTLRQKMRLLDIPDADPVGSDG